MTELALNFLTSVYETGRKIAVGPRPLPPERIPILPTEILRVICEELVSECLVDCMLNPHMFSDPPDPEVENYLIPTLVNLAHSSSTFHTLVINMIASALLLEYLPDGRLSTNPFSAIAKLHYQLKHSKRYVLDISPSRTLNEIDMAMELNSDIVCDYLISIQALFECARGMVELFTLSDYHQGSQTPTTWQKQLLICSSMTELASSPVADMLKYVIKRMACAPVVRTKLVRRAREGVFQSTALAFMRKVATRAYEHMKLLQATDFGNKTQDQQIALLGEAAEIARNLLHVEKVCCDVSTTNAVLPPLVPAELDGEIILLSGMFSIAIYLKVKGTVIDGVDIAAIGQTLFNRWKPRISEAYWNKVRLNDENFHPAFVDLFENYFLLPFPR